VCLAALIGWSPRHAEKAPPRAAGYVWWEGEQPLETNFPRQTSFSASTFPAKREGLSGGDWLTNEGRRTGPEAFARYRVEVPAGGTYFLWARKFWKHGPFRWRFDDGEWRICPADVALADSFDIRQFLGANWVHLDRVTLAPGAHTFELRLLAKEGEPLTACFDCFVLSRLPFEPRGRLKPGERSGQADAGFFPWEPAMDAFTPDALLDFRFLNEKVAGERGRVRSNGMRFQLGSGRPVRFWGVNAGPEVIGLDPASVDYLARRLAKVGVNIVRFHGPLFDEGAADRARVNARRLDRLHYFVSALKKQGIYTTLSFYFPLWYPIQGKPAFSVLYFDPEMQRVYRAWARALLTTKNPYTGLTLAADPAVAIVEMVNEDSHFFWTFRPEQFPPEHRQRLEKLYGDWLARRYGSVDKAIQAWDDIREPSDDPVAGRAAIYPAFMMTRQGFGSQPRKQKRVSDQVRFLTENMRGFYAETVRFFRQECGYAGLVSASNWQVADPQVLDALERYCYTAGDVIDRHGYFDAEHKGDGASYSVRAGHTFANLAATTVPERLPLPFFQVDGHPHMISEIGWTNPNRFRADYAFLASAYGSLQGMDAYFAFALGGAFWDRSMAKFTVNSPAIMGNFPAHALLYRRGDIREAPDVIHQVLSLNDLYHLQGSGGAAPQALDALRAADAPSGRGREGESERGRDGTSERGGGGGSEGADKSGRPGRLAPVSPSLAPSLSPSSRPSLPPSLAAHRGPVRTIDPLAYYVGRVVRAFGTDAGVSTQVDLAPYLDRGARTVRSITGELRWDYGRGVVTLNAARAQGAAGFLRRAGRIDLQDVAITMQNEYGTVTLVALDDLPLARSHKLLIETMTVERPYGFRASEGTSGTILDLGTAPFGVERVACTVKLKGVRGTPRVVALDEHGYPTKNPVRVTPDTAGAAVTLAPDAVYHVVLR
jgi:hypothetical protein